MNFISMNNKSEKLNYYPDSFRSQSKILGILGGGGVFLSWYYILKDRGHEWDTFVPREAKNFCHITCELYLLILSCDTFYIPYHKKLPIQNDLLYQLYDVPQLQRY